jgi:WD40-like Beta Propeller Repeat
VTEADVRKLLLAADLPRAREAELRSWALVRAEFKRREPVSWSRRRLRPLLALAAVAALLAAALTPPGRGLAERLREAVAEDAPGPITLPTSGRLLVLTAEGPWVVQQDGSKRRLGAYEDAVWSPRGLFVGATRGRTLVALEPNGTVRWTLPRPERVSAPRWSPSGFRIAYRSGDRIRVVAGDGTGDTLLTPPAGEAAPAWRPDSAHVLAFSDRQGRIEIVNTDTSAGTLLGTHVAAPARELAWSSDGRRLLALVGESTVQIWNARGQRLRSVAGPDGETLSDLTTAPDGQGFALIAFNPRTETSSVLLATGENPDAGSPVFSGAGRFDGIAWSPDGRWLLVGWPDADQWLFLRADVRRVVTVSAVSSEFDPGGSGQGRFPRVVSWCC